MESSLRVGRAGRKYQRKIVGYLISRREVEVTSRRSQLGGVVVVGGEQQRRGRGRRRARAGLGLRLVGVGGGGRGRGRAGGGAVGAGRAAAARGGGAGRRAGGGPRVAPAQAVRRRARPRHRAAHSARTTEPAYYVLLLPQFCLVISISRLKSYHTVIFFNTEQVVHFIYLLFHF